MLLALLLCVSLRLCLRCLLLLNRCGSLSLLFGGLCLCGLQALVVELRLSGLVCGDPPSLLLGLRRLGCRCLLVCRLRGLCRCGLLLGLDDLSSFLDPRVEELVAAAQLHQVGPGDPGHHVHDLVGESGVYMVHPLPDVMLYLCRAVRLLLGCPGVAGLRRC